MRYRNFYEIPNEILHIPDKFLDMQFYIQHSKNNGKEVVSVNIPESYMDDTYTTFRYFCLGCGVTMLANSKEFGSTINELAKKNAIEEYSCDACGVHVTFEFKVDDKNLGKHLSFDNNPQNMHD